MVRGTWWCDVKQAEQQIKYEEWKTREMMSVARVMPKPPSLGDTADNPI